MSYYKKCRDCKYLDVQEKKSIGCLCRNSGKKFRTDVAMWKYPTAKACKLFEEKEDQEPTAEWKRQMMRTFLGERE